MTPIARAATGCNEGARSRPIAGTNLPPGSPWQPLCADVAQFAVRKVREGGRPDPTRGRHTCQQLNSWQTVLGLDATRTRAHSFLLLLRSVPLQSPVPGSSSRSENVETASLGSPSSLVQEVQPLASTPRRSPPPLSAATCCPRQFCKTVKGGKAHSGCPILAVNTRCTTVFNLF